jgi:hypothetical protein
MAEPWDCSPATVRKMIYSGQISVIRFGSMVRILLAAIAAYEERWEETIVPRKTGMDRCPHPPAGPDWHSSATQRPSSEPDKIEYCLFSGGVLNSFPYPLGHETSRAACLAFAQRVLGTYWQWTDGGQPKMKGRPLPDFVRVADNQGKEVCRWSWTICEPTMPPLGDRENGSV